MYGIMRILLLLLARLSHIVLHALEGMDVAATEDGAAFCQWSDRASGAATQDSIAMKSCRCFPRW